MTVVTVRATYTPRDLRYDTVIPAGSTVAVQGPNGHGKSTFVGLISGLLRPTSGVVMLGDKVVASDAQWVPPHRRPVATLLQRTELFGHRSVLGNAAYGLRSAGWARRDAREQAALWLDRCGMGEFAARRASALSGGQARRVAVARTLATPADVVLLDEPTAGIDRAVLPLVLQAIEWRAEHCTMIIVTHDKDVVEVADSALTL